MLADLRYALRGLRRSPGFTAVAVLSLALGIGANTAIFSLVNAVILRTLPVRQPDRLVLFGLNTPDRFGQYPIGQALTRHIGDENTVLEGFSGVTFPSITISGDQDPERLSALLVTGNFFETLGVRPLLGRLLTPDDDRVPDGPNVCVLGYGLWQRRFGRNADIVGRKIQINAQPFTILGVTPKEFVGISQNSEMDIGIPLTATAMGESKNFALQTFGRLKPGVSIAQAQAELDILYHRYAPPPRVGKISDVKVRLQPGSQGLSRLRSEYERPLLLLMTVVGMVLLIACANLANLLLARASRRTKEIAVRLALGAGWATLIRQMLVESTLLATAGMAVGLALAYWADHALVALAPRRLGGGASIVNVNPEARVLLFTLGVAILVSMLSGLAPAIRSTRPGLGPALKGEAGPRAPGRISLTNALVVAQIALSFVLLIGAGLFLRSLIKVKSVDPGLDPARLVVITIDGAGLTLTESLNLFDRLAERARSLPGVVAVSPAFISPLSGGFATANIKVPGYELAEGESDSVNVNWIGPEYFKTLGTPLLNGRVFDERDGREDKVSIVNERAAIHFWRHEDPIGKHIVLGRGIDTQVVGVVKDERIDSLRTDPQPVVYFPYLQNTRGHVSLHVKVSGQTAPVIQALIRESHAIEPNVPIVRATTMEEQLSETMQLDRLMATLTVLFGLVGVVLAAVGLFGVMAFAVAVRTREIGIRMALGAGHGRVLATVMMESAALTALGITVGLPLALWASRGARSFLYGVSATDPWMYGSLALALAAVSLGAAWIPARRAASVDPMVALRYE